MHRTISDCKITKRKDERYYVRLQNGNNTMHVDLDTKLHLKIAVISIEKIK
ncbi:MAG: hypothetical protein IKA47_02730 [Oscillospiraceae bacterium]|nr:hypothetical protein [Oscillospiraceae bacterium]